MHQKTYYLLGGLGIIVPSNSLYQDYEIRSKPLFEVHLRHLTLWLDKEPGL